MRFLTQVGMFAFLKLCYSGFVVDILFFLLLLNLSYLCQFIGIRFFLFIATYCVEKYFFSFSFVYIFCVSLICDAFYCDIIGTHFSICLFIVYCFSDLRIENPKFYLSSHINTKNLLICYIFFILSWGVIFSIFNYKLIDIKYIILCIVSSTLVFPLIGMTCNLFYRIRNEQKV